MATLPARLFYDADSGTLLAQAGGEEVATVLTAEAEGADLDSFFVLISAYLVLLPHHSLLLAFVHVYIA